MSELWDRGAHHIGERRKRDEKNGRSLVDRVSIKHYLHMQETQITTYIYYLYLLFVARPAPTNILHAYTHAHTLTHIYNIYIYFRIGTLDDLVVFGGLLIVPYVRKLINMPSARITAWIFKIFTRRGPCVPTTQRIERARAVLVTLIDSIERLTVNTFSSLPHYQHCLPFFHLQRS